MDNQTEQTFENDEHSYDFGFDFGITDEDIQNMMAVNGLRTVGTPFSALHSDQATQGIQPKSPTTHASEEKEERLCLSAKETSESNSTTTSTSSSDTSYTSIYSTLLAYETIQGTKRKASDVDDTSKRKKEKNRISAKKTREAKKRTLEENKQEIQSLHEMIKALQADNEALRSDNINLQKENFALKAAQSNSPFNL